MTFLTRKEEILLAGNGLLVIYFQGGVKVGIILDKRQRERQIENAVLQNNLQRKVR